MRRVERGALLGTIVNVLENVQVPVHAENAGVVIMLHIFPYARKEAGLAVVLEGQPAGKEQP